ncbi:hypothetical protein QJS66_22010 [Kocuria rhizophila]|nr:hypothetical protein QJS66_22010 [Kocuria rhizophila]
MGPELLVTGSPGRADGHHRRWLLSRGRPDRRRHRPHAGPPGVVDSCTRAPADPQVPELVAAVAVLRGCSPSWHVERALLHDGWRDADRVRACSEHHQRVRRDRRGDRGRGFDVVVDVDWWTSVCDAAERVGAVHLLTRKPSEGGRAHTVERDFVVTWTSPGHHPAPRARLTSVDLRPVRVGAHRSLRISPDCASCWGRVSRPEPPAGGPRRRPRVG